MAKRIFYYCIVIVFLFIVGLQLHEYVLKIENYKISYSLSDTYLFHLISSFAVYLIIEVVAWRLPSQAGFAFLATVFLKIGIFTLIFRSSLFSDIDLTMPERLSLIIPMFTFLLIETAACGRLLNAK